LRKTVVKEDLSVEKQEIVKKPCCDEKRLKICKYADVSIA